MALLLPATFSFSSTSTIILLAGIYYGVQYGGSTTSILVNIPGEASSVMTCLDGHQMARQGRAGPALGIAAWGSFIAGTLSNIGLMLVAIIRTAGVNNIIAIDGNDGRLALAREMGADHTINFRGYPSGESLAAEVLNVTKGMGAHFAFSVTGVPQAASSIFKLVRRGGGVCEVGFFVDNGLCSVNPHEDFCKKEITLVGTWAYNSWEYPNAYHFLQRAARIGIPVEKLITHRFPLDRIGEAFQTNLRQEGIKIVVEAR
jgi:threonine dehydrogenase-like Zn-dependent dehydrogenase